nr:hypothetical protein Ade03nite_60620 [Actinoplanes derwentensis]
MPAKGPYGDTSTGRRFIGTTRLAWLYGRLIRAGFKDHPPASPSPSDPRIRPPGHFKDPIIYLSTPIRRMRDLPLDPARSRPRHPDDAVSNLGTFTYRLLSI